MDIDGCLEFISEFDSIGAFVWYLVSVTQLHTQKENYFTNIPKYIWVTPKTRALSAFLGRSLNAHTDGVIVTTIICFCQIGNANLSDKSAGPLREVAKFNKKTLCVPLLCVNNLLGDTWQSGGLEFEKPTLLTQRSSLLIAFVQFIEIHCELWDLKIWTILKRKVQLNSISATGERPEKRRFVRDFRKSLHLSNVQMILFNKICCLECFNENILDRPTFTQVTSRLERKQADQSRRWFHRKSHYKFQVQESLEIPTEVQWLNPVGKPCKASRIEFNRRQAIRKASIFELGG